MKKQIIKHTKMIKVAFVAVFFAAMAFNVAMVASSPHAGKANLTLNGLKVMAFGPGEGNCNGLPCGTCIADWQCIPGRTHCNLETNRCEPNKPRCQFTSQCPPGLVCWDGVCQ